jgi:O-acetyl-ADP-ribose deacetylase (regulator of RNase III)
MIETRYGNALDVNTGIIVHGCNCLGIMGGGIAREVKNRFPLAFHEYDKVHQSRGLKLGEICFAEVSPNKFIINANTQQDIGGPKRQVSYDAIAECFYEVVKFAKVVEQHRGQKLEIIFPAIGAGLGGGDWNVIAAIIDVVIPEEYTKVLYLLPPISSTTTVLEA